MSPERAAPDDPEPRPVRRFAPLPDDAMSPEQREVAKVLSDGPRGGVRGPFPALLRNPKLADRVRALGECIRFESQVSQALREFVILLVARHWSARYEWHAHSIAAEAAGVPREIIEAIGHNKTPERMTPDQQVLHRFFKQLLERCDVEDDAYGQAIDRFGEETLLELISTASYFCFVSLILNAVRYPVPEGGRLLPDLPTTNTSVNDS